MAKNNCQTEKILGIHFFDRRCFFIYDKKESTSPAR
jgi:hypothetical protein